MTAGEATWKLIAAYLIFIPSCWPSSSRERLPGLSPALLCPSDLDHPLPFPELIPMLVSIQGDFGGPLKVDVEGSSVDAIFLSILILIGLRASIGEEPDIAKAAIKRQQGLVRAVRLGTDRHDLGRMSR
ncbi:MAG: hypothetical protein MZU91_11790 [Desulfosudis oleivorans]|nr:hypothetical protein [Desulfosudis oleivorans]